MSSTPLDVRIEDHTITTQDQTLLTAKVYRPIDHNNHTVLIAPAMGMPQRFYRHYATYLAEQGCVVLTFDYRAISTSKGKISVRRSKASLVDWATQDLQAMIQWLTRQYPTTNLTVVGHSLGGHLVGATSDAHKVNNILGVSAQNTHWKNWSAWQQPIIGLFWFGLIPMLSRLLGFFPSGWFGMGEALPKQVALDWSASANDFSGTRGFFMGTPHDHYDDFVGYTRFYSFTDDTLMAPKKSVDAIIGFYTNATDQQRPHISPDSVGVDAIGHNRFFRPEMRETLWQETLTWLMNPASTSANAGA